MTVVTFVLTQGVKVQHGRPDNLDAAMRKADQVNLFILAFILIIAYQVNLCLLQLGPGK